jgi:hypothetical protein
VASEALGRVLLVRLGQVIAAWIGHKDDSLTMRFYAHSQEDALKAAGDTFNRVVTSS